MTLYIALVRGINVGGKNKVKMADLKKMFETIGLQNVQTYIQSGNVLFESDEEELPLRKRIEEAFETTFGFAVSMVLRTAEELLRVAGNCPFTEAEVAEAEAMGEWESLYVAFLLDEPTQEGIERVKPYQSVKDHYRIVGRDVYLLFHHSVRDSKLATNLHKLDVPATVRNWKTVSKLVAMVEARKE